MDVEPDCQRGRLITRRGTEEVIQESVKKILAPLAARRKLGPRDPPPAGRDRKCKT